MMGTMQTCSLLCCFALFFLLPHHLTAGSPDLLRTPEPVAAQMKQPSAASGLQGHPPAELGDIHDIYGPVPLPETPPYWLYGFGTLLIAAAGALLLVLFRFRNSRRKTVPIEPGVQALADLQKAEKEHQKTGDLFRYCDDVSAVLRAYVERASGYRISSRTTLESLNELENGSGRHQFGDRDGLDRLRRCLTRCDMVRFARFSPDQTEIEQIGRLAESFVSATGTGEKP